MNVKLVYLYIKDINRPFDKMEFTFTNDFKIQFNPDNLKIKIKKNNDNIQNFWGEDINSIDVVIGRNGSGKSTILDLLAQNTMNRDNIFNDGKKKIEWFAIYHIADNEFIIEGSNYQILPIIKINDRLDKQYSIICNYDSVLGQFNYLNHIQQHTWNNGGRTTSIDDSLIYLYDTASVPAKSWTNNNIRRFDDNSSFSFKRHYVAYPSYSSIYRFINFEYDKIEKELFSAQNVMCEITTNVIYNKLEVQGTFNLKLYSDGEPLKFRLSKNYLRSVGNNNQLFEKYETSLSIKEQYIITMLENIIMNLWIERVAKKEEDKKNFNRFDDKWIDTIAQKISESSMPLNEDFNVIKEHLYHVIKILYAAYNEKYKRSEVNDTYASSISSFMECLLSLNNEFFINYNLVEIPVSKIYDARVDELLNIYDSYVADDDDMFSHLKTLINMKYTNLSTGELQFLDRFASLYKTINTKSDYYVKNMIICLDEPEGTFHPEWARKYIYYLVKFLNIINESKDMKFQIIIATHSPFIVSDIPKQNINCIKFCEEQNKVINRKVEKANFGFASNLYDIVGDDFFVKSSIGEFALEKINGLLKRIMELKKSNIEDSINEIKITIELIGDQVIKNKLAYLLKEKEIQFLPKMDEKDRRILELEKEVASLKEKVNDKN